MTYMPGYMDLIKANKFKQFLLINAHQFFHGKQPDIGSLFPVVSRKQSYNNIKYAGAVRILKYCKNELKVNCSLLRVQHSRYYFSQQLRNNMPSKQTLNTGRCYSTKIPIQSQAHCMALRKLSCAQSATCKMA